MELKRILAKDLRRATEKAVKLYGEDVLVISNAKVNGQHEVIVAVDLGAEPAHEDSPWLQANRSTDDGDTKLFQTALRESVREQKELSDDIEDDVTYDSVLRQRAQAESSNSTTDRRAADHRDYIRGREIVDLVRDELAAIRKEFKMAQRINAWQSESPSRSAVKPLVAALAEASIPVSLRTLLVDHVSAMDDLAQAKQSLHAHLSKSMGEHWAKLPQRGVHAITGPAGAGKTMMVARLARTAAERKGPESVAVISYADQRAGAWSQIQMLCAQAGVDCLRANDPETLKILLGELGQRHLVLIDTPGVEVFTRIEQIRSCSTDIACHLLLPADAAGTTVRKYLVEAPNPWHSLMASRLDEATQPWALIQVLCDKPVPLSAASHSPLATEGCTVLTANELVTLAIRGLSVEMPLVADELVDDSGIEVTDPSVMTAAQALVARLEKSAHAS
ncbi:FlhF Flagellar GTP-binding protein [Oxalobacteraceae bacterium]|jgi:flagellar biosynthesis protein FlhF